MNAEKARKITNDRLENDLPNQEYDSVIESIKLEARSGSYSIFYDELFDKTIKRLKNDGYKVKKDWICGGYNISWK